MILTLEQIRDYTYCPKFYKLCHVDDVMKSKDALIEYKFDTAMKQTANFFFYSIQDGTIPSIKDIRKKFGDLYIGNRTVSETAMLNKSKRNLARILENRSIDMLSNFYNKFSVEHGVPILVNKEYELKIGDTIVQGKFPIIRETNDKNIEILHFYVDSTMYLRETLPVTMKYDINITASALAFNTMYGNKIDDHTYYGLYTGNEIKISKTKSDYKSFIQMVNGVSSAIQNNIFYPVWNNNCINCAYNKSCTKG